MVSVSLIKDAARSLNIKNSEICEFELKTQFRCSGSDIFLQWIENILEIKKNLEIINQDMARIKVFLETASSEFSKFARKEDLEILSKQAKMFQPLALKRN